MAQPISLIVLLALSLSLGLASGAIAQGCQFDEQCKGDRICENSRCVDPRPSTRDKSQGRNTTRDKNQDAEDSSRAGGQGLPHYCCTSGGKLGPYPNPDARTGQRVPEGGACYGTTRFGQVAYGVACY